MKSGIYLWTVIRPDNPNGCLVYVGQAADLLRRRKEYERSWERDQVRENERLHYAVRKYGPTRVQYRVLAECAQERLTELERHWYWHFKAQEGLGMCEVANFVEPETSPMGSPEARKKISASWDDNRRRRQREANDQHWDDSARAEARQAAKGAWDSYTPEERAARAARQARAPKTVTMRSPAGEKVTITNIARFCQEHGFDTSAFRRVVNGKASSYRGWCRYQ